MMPMAEGGIFRTKGESYSVAGRSPARPAGATLVMEAFPAPAAHGRPGTGHRAGSRAGRRGRPSCWLQVGLEAVDVDRVARAGVRPPQLAALEADGVAVLRNLFTGRGVRIGEDEHAMVALDDAVLVARVAWQPRVARRVQVLRAHAVTPLEARARQRILPTPGPA